MKQLPTPVKVELMIVWMALIWAAPLGLEAVNASVCVTPAPDSGDASETDGA
jgi:hypothetical protein